MILDRMKKETEIEHLCRYQYAKQFVVGKKVLDAACGSGYGTNILAENATEAVGMDISADAIVYADNMYKLPNVRFLVGSVERLPFDDQSFDVIVSFETIEHVNEIIQKSFLNEIKRVLRKDGVLIMSTPNKKKFTDEKGGKLSEFHVKEFYVDEFKDFLKSKFDFVIFEQQFYAQSACIIGEKDCQAQISGFEDEGMYVVAIASNTDIREIAGSSFILRYPKEYEQMNDFAQVYYSDTMNFTEENSRMVEINNRNVCQKICIHLDGIKCKYLRVDPISGRGIIRIDRIEITLAGGERIEIVNYISNAVKEENGILYFCIEDTQIVIDLEDEKSVESVDIEFSLVNWEDGLNGDDAAIQILAKDNEHLKRENEFFKRENEFLKRENGIMLEQLTNIYNSKTWKIQQKVAKFLDR